MEGAEHELIQLYASIASGDEWIHYTAFEEQLSYSEIGQIRKKIAAVRIFQHCYLTTMEIERVRNAFDGMANIDYVEMVNTVG